MKNFIKLNKRKIDLKSHVFVIAEAGVNHNNNLSLAYKMIDVAKKAGADAIKFQTFVSDEIQLKTSTKPNYQKKIKNPSYYKIIKSLEPSFRDQVKLSNYCKRKGILFLSTPYDEKSVDFLDSIKVPAFKIASTDLTNHFLLRYIAKKRKPIFLSTGLADSKQVDESVNFLKKLKIKNQLIIFHTTSDYPAKNSEVNLNIIPEYIKKYHVPIGYFDHTQSDVASLGAIALGARILEKHFTLDKKLPGPDQSSSLEPKELTDWIKKIRIMESSLGENKKKITNSEKKNLSMRKVIVIKPSSRGTKLSTKHLTAMRGKNSGILPLDSNIRKILGTKLLFDIYEKREFSWNMIK